MTSNAWRHRFRLKDKGGDQHSIQFLRSTVAVSQDQITRVPNMGEVHPEQSLALPAPVQIVVGFSQERGLASFSCSPPTRLPESPLAKLLKAQKQLPRLKLVTKVARAEQSLCTNSNGLQMPRTIAGTSREDECASGRTSHTSSLSRSSDPICIPEMCAR